MLSAVVPDLPFVALLTPPDTPLISGTRWFWVQSDRVSVTEAPPDDGWPLHFLGMLGTEACWAVDVPDGAEEPDDGAGCGRPFMDLRQLWGRLSEVSWTVAGRAVQLVTWGRTHRFCGRCGTATVPAPGDRAMRCEACGLLAYPRLAPAIITLVHRRGADGVTEALLGRGVQFPMPMYSCLAGFVEPGETLEEAVRREVTEEVGVRVTDVRYLGSQPWPFPHSLMIGFSARWLEGDIEIDPREIADAQWFRPDELPPVPPAISIARSLIDRWLDGALD
jgi:NAD+ diphosphatase